VETWLYAILINQHRRRLRTKSRLERRLLRWIEWAWSAPEETPPEKRMELEEWRESIWRRVAELPEPQRHAIVLRYSEELSYEEIAQVLGCPVGTVKSRLHHAMAALRVELVEPDEVDEDLKCNGSPLAAKHRLLNDIRNE
jgi:RNA polymerase sigma-70 factor (ECF subfamily)